MENEHTEMVSRAVRAIRDEYLSEGKASSYQEINHGLCGDFAVEVILRVCKEMGIEMSEMEIVGEHGVTDFVQVDPETGFSYDTGGPFDREMLAENWPGVQPPEGLSWDELDALSADVGFDAGTHVFLRCNGLFFDAEAPDGVPSFFELPFFVRVTENWLQEREQSPAPV